MKKWIQAEWWMKKRLKGGMVGVGRKLSAGNCGNIEDGGERSAGALDDHKGFKRDHLVIFEAGGGDVEFSRIGVGDVDERRLDVIGDQNGWWNGSIVAVGLQVAQWREERNAGGGGQFGGLVAVQVLVGFPIGGAPVIGFK